MDTLVSSVLPLLSALLDKKENADKAGERSAKGDASAQLQPHHQPPKLVSGGMELGLELTQDLAKLLKAVEVSSKVALSNADRSVSTVGGMSSPSVTGSSSAPRGSPMYALILLSELRRVLKLLRRQNPVGSSFGPLLHLAHGLLVLRMQIFNILVSLASARCSESPRSFRQLARGVSRALAVFEKSVRTASALEPNMCDAPRYECRLLESLFLAHAAASSLQFFEAVFLCSESSRHLREWDQFLVSTSSGSVEAVDDYSTSKSAYAPIRGWLGRLLSAALSKTGLYFGRTLGDIGSQTLDCPRPAAELDFCSLFGKFQKRAEAAVVAIVANSTSSSTLSAPGGTIGGPHVCLPMQDADSDSEPLQGLRSFPALFFEPEARQQMLIAEHWPNVVSLLLEQSATTEVYYHFDNKLSNTFFIACVDPSLFLVVVFEKKVKQSERTVSEFISVVLDGLRLTSLRRSW